jgi:hypothetical protein
MSAGAVRQQKSTSCWAGGRVRGEGGCDGFRRAVLGCHMIYTDCMLTRFTTVRHARVASNQWTERPAASLTSSPATAAAPAAAPAASRMAAPTGSDGSSHSWTCGTAHMTAAALQRGGRRQSKQGQRALQIKVAPRLPQPPAMTCEQPIRPNCVKIRGRRPPECESRPFVEEDGEGHGAACQGRTVREPLAAGMPQLGSWGSSIAI